MASQASAEVVWRGDFETGDLSQWTRSQAVSSDRLRVVSSPTTQGRHALKVVVQQGDNPIDASGNRNELVQTTFEPEGSEYWYRWQTMFDPSFPSADTWQLFTQWHHTGPNGSPPVEFFVRGERINLNVGSETQWSAPLKRGVWHDFVFHVRWSPNRSVGFVELWFNGERVLPKRFLATQFEGQLNYLKQGLYRNSTVGPTGVVYHDGFTMGRTQADVVSVATPPAEPPPAADPPADPAVPEPGDPVVPPSVPVEPDATDEPGAQPSVPVAPDATEEPETQPSVPVVPQVPGAPPSEPDVLVKLDPQVGCTAGAGLAMPAASLLLAGLLRRRRRR